VAIEYLLIVDPAWPKRILVTGHTHGAAAVAPVNHSFSVSLNVPTYVMETPEETFTAIGTTLSSTPILPRRLYSYVHSG